MRNNFRREGMDDYLGRIQLIASLRFEPFYLLLHQPHIPQVPP